MALSAKWGQVTVPDGTQYKDVMVSYYNGQTRHRVWDWKVHYTHHVPGIGNNDVLDLLALTQTERPTIILSQGYEGALHVASRSQLEALLKGEIYVLRTSEAIELYNKLVSQGTGEVAMLLHTTC